MIQYSSLNDAWGNSNKEIYKKIINNDILNTENIDSITTPSIDDSKTPPSTLVTNSENNKEENMKTEPSIYNLNQPRNNVFSIVKKNGNVINNEQMTNTDKKSLHDRNHCIESNDMIHHLTVCKECRDKLKLLLENDNNIKINLNGIKLNINRNILKIIFVLLIFLILLILISMCKKQYNSTNNKYYSVNDMYLEPYLRQMLYNKL